jgi:hypothetical protein
LSNDVLADLLVAADELTDGRQHTERTPYWDDNRNRKFRTHKVTLPGLLAQLYESVYPSAGGEGGRRPHPGSRPPLALEALSTHTVITIAVVKWCWDLRIDQRDTVESNIRALVAAVTLQDADVQHRLRADLRRWRTWCAVMTGWERVDTYPAVSCPVCDLRGSLRVNLTTGRGYCTNHDLDADGTLVCGSTWTADDGTLMVLGQHIRTTQGVAA